MPPRQPRARDTAIRVAAAFAGALVLAGCGGDSAEPRAAPGLVTTAPDSSATVSPGGFGAGPYGGPCIERPSRTADVEPLPDGLTLPPESYPISEFDFRSGAFLGVVFAVPMEYPDFVDFAREEWPRLGWLVGHGETEFGEAENTFIRGEEYGGFRARRVYCEEGWSEIVFIVGRDPKYAPMSSTSSTP